MTTGQARQAPCSGQEQQRWAHQQETPDHQVCEVAAEGAAGVPEEPAHTDHHHGKEVRGGHQGGQEQGGAGGAGQAF